MEISTITQTAADKATQQAPERRISKRIRHACDLLLSGEVATIKAAAERANLSREHLSRTIAEPHVQAYLARKTRETVAGMQMRAAAVLERLLESAESEHVRKDVALRVLELNGIKPSDTPSVSITLNTPGYVIDLSASPQIAHQAQEPANPMIDLTPVPDELRGTRFEDVHPVNSDEGEADE